MSDHAQVIGHLQNAIKLDKVSHAYILNGEKGSGKKMLASVFSQVLQCEEKGQESCLGNAGPAGRQRVETIQISYGSPMKNRTVSV